MSTVCHPDMDVRYAYARIHDFFDHYGLDGASEDIESILRSTMNNKVWKMNEPYLLVYFMEKLEALSSAAYTIHHQHGIISDAILEEPENKQPDLSQHHHFVDTLRHSNAWNNFPRNLTAKQYHNPYKAITKYCGHQTELEWKTLFKEITEYALSRDSITASSPPYNMLTIRLRLLQLIEACHLLNLRINNKKEKTGDTIKAEDT